MVRENMTVKVVGGLYEGKTGKVVRIYPGVDVALVSFDDNGDIGKVALSALIEIQRQEKEVTSEIPEGAKKISRADYDMALIEAVSVAVGTTRNPDAGLTGAISAAVVGEFIGSDIIFEDSDVVTMTEDQLIGVLWEGCRPERVSEIVGGAMSMSKALSVSVASIMTLRKIPRILFGAENG